MTHNAVGFRFTPRRSALGSVALASAVSLLLWGAGAGAAAAQPGRAAASVAGGTATAVGSTTTPPAPAAGQPLTNLAHLDFLLDAVPLTQTAEHTTYRLAEQPTAQAPWTYANRNADGSYTRIGGGSLDAGTGHWSQGAYNADDIARTAVVYLRHWKLTGDASSRDHAVQTLRALTYLQTASGPNAGNVVLWQQADGTLTPSATPKELPDPSDSAESYWVARTLWALGEGYAAFSGTGAGGDPAFAAFLQDRLHLSLDALNRQSLARYGTFDVADGVKVPAWLIAGGADASAEAAIGLAAFSAADPGDSVVRTALTRLTEGVAAMSSGSLTQWPFGAILPWNKSQSLWHAWGGLAPAAVATAGTVLGRPDLLKAAVADSAQFTPQLLAAGGADNAWSPTPGEAQIAYGVDSRVEGLVATAKAANAPGLLDVAAIYAGWFFGANRSGLPAYNPATGTAIDGIERDGRVNPNSGAESTIHTLLTMLTLDANPELRAKALGIEKTVATAGLSVVEAESGTITGGSVVTPASAWTGEANLSGGAYVSLTKGGSLSVPVPANDQARNVYPIVNQTEARSGNTSWASARAALGSTANGGAGAQGITDAPGRLLPLSLSRTLPAGSTAVTGTSSGAAAIDALLLQPLVSTVTVTGPAGDSTLYVSAARESSVRPVLVPRGFRLEQAAYDAAGRPVAHADERGNPARASVTVAPGGFTVTHLTRR
ncbi:MULTISPECIES: hypothetical protein [Cryobacterium]|uniref:Uncharacterized protein n=1 Tax=Cryobacterium glucosi TaxID=1259175 RepID=A0ABY2IP81_9MICO|nr:MULTISPECIES: hypothetical protein [Cryobacterium]TFB97980.1 hypothetical protein E3O39_07210 [Cryobacterium sp. MDB2-A-1]TFC10914.1 hypothetical protein E3O35_12115 [Cryobacterium sp. MDB2-A-2]TFC14391.1 hypothetical protein E3O51_15435 [Cryobacterium sp. MDB2-10]TFC19355.1 hypothetical protein E3O46_12365 [Cryobacterium glucosi]